MNSFTVPALILLLTITGCDKLKTIATCCEKPKTIATCEQSEVLKTVEKIVNNLDVAKANGAQFVALKSIVEDGYNKETETRTCKAILVTTKGDDNFQYTINWQDKEKTNFYIQAQVLAGIEEAATITVKDIYDTVATDMVERYEMAKRNNASSIDICVQAGLVSAGFLQAKNEEEYKKWKGIERSDCAVAGIQK